MPRFCREAASGTFARHQYYGAFDDHLQFAFKLISCQSRSRKYLGDNR